MRHVHHMIVVMILLMGWTSWAQLPNCTLNIGGDNTQTIITIFQLNEEQQQQLEQWHAEYGVEAKLIEDQMQKLLEEHPQSNTDDLYLLGEKYKGLQTKMEALVVVYDRKLISVFNEKQYQRYRELCSEAFRRPLSPLPE